MRIRGNDPWLEELQPSSREPDPSSQWGLIATNLSMFYDQNWYHDEEFTNTPLKEGSYSLRKEGPCSLSSTASNIRPSAALCAYTYLAYPNSRHSFNGYVWTSDFDKAGNQIYVGGLQFNQLGTFEIHRHLKSPNVQDLWVEQ